jgi:uncharacterized membrane protein YedE/YeeE
MRKMKYLPLMLAFGALSSMASAQFYTSQANFLANVAPDYYMEQFNGFSFGNPLNGSQVTWNAPGANGFGWQASAPNGLWSNPGALSTNNANDPITITFTGRPVFAWGADIAGTDINGNPITSMVTFTTSTGATFSHTVSTFSFIGFVSSQQLTSVLIDTTQPGTNSWPAIDNAITAVPEPGTMIALGLGAAALLRRRRNRK